MFCIDFNSGLHSYKKYLSYIKYRRRLAYVNLTIITSRKACNAVKSEGATSFFPPDEQKNHRSLHNKRKSLKG